ASIDNMPASQGPGWGTTSWAGCVDARLNGMDATDDPPASGDTNSLFHEYYWPSDSFDYGSPFNNKQGQANGTNKWATKKFKRCKVSDPTSCSNVSNTCSPTGSGGPYTCTLKPYTYSSPLNTTQQGPNFECPQQVTPMTNSATTLTDAISSMQPLGNTEIN